MKGFQCRSFLYSIKIFSQHMPFSSLDKFQNSADYGWYLDGTKLQTGHLVVAKPFLNEP